MTSLKFMHPPLHPRRIFAVTGTPASRFTRRTISPHFGGSRMRADPAPPRITFAAGHPMLMSMKSTSGFVLRTEAATAAKTSGSLPNSCTPVGRPRANRR